MLQILYADQPPPTGSSGHKVPYLDVANTWSADQTISMSGPSLILDRTDANGAGLYGTRGMLNRWDMEFGNNAAESGVDGVGSDLVLTRYHNDGSWWSAPLWISRQTGQVTLSHDMTVNGVSYFYSAPWVILSGVGIVMSVVSTDPGAVAAPDFAIFRDSASPAASDAIGRILFQGRNSAATPIAYSQNSVVINNATAGSESATYSIATYLAGVSSPRLGVAAGMVINGAAGAAPTGGDKGVGTLNVATALYENGTALTGKYGQLAVANTWSLAQTITVTDTFAALTLNSTDAGAAGAPSLMLFRDSASPAVNDGIGQINFYGRNSAAASKFYTQIANQIINPVAGSETGAMYFATSVAGSPTIKFYIQSGMWSQNATGGDKGADTINASALYEGGIALTAKYGQLAVANTWTATQTIDIGATLGNGLIIRSSEPGASVGPDLVLDRFSASPAANDVLGRIDFQGTKTDASIQIYTTIRSAITDPNPGTYAAIITFTTVQAGLGGVRLNIGAGISTGGATGGDKGADTINATALYESGSPISGRYTGGAGSGNILRRNGGLEIWQRGAGGAASFAIAASGFQYTADGWFFACGVNEASTVSQQAGLTNGSQYSAKVQRNSGQTGTSGMSFEFPLDTDEIYPLLGQFVLLSFTAKAGANWSASTLSTTFGVGTGAPNRLGGFTSLTTPIATVSTPITTTPTRFQFISSVFIPVNTRQASVYLAWTPAGTAGADDSVTIDDVQLEIVPAASGYVATAFQRLTFTEQLLLCQRHFWKTFNYNTAPASGLGAGFGEFRFTQALGASLTQVFNSVPLPVPMRAAPTVVSYSTVGAGANIYDATGSLNWTSTSANANPNEVWVNGVTPAGSAAGHGSSVHLTADAGI